MSCDYRIEVSRDFFGTHSWWVSTRLSVGSTGLVKVEIYRFLFVTCPLGRCVRWLWGWGPRIPSHHPAKFGIHRPCESEDITCLFVTWPLIRCVTWLSGWAPLILSHHPAKFAVDRPYESEYITFFICHVTTKFGVHKVFWKWRYSSFYLSRDYNIEVSRDFLGGVLSS